MENQQDILKLELKNLYALEKQSEEIMTSINEVIQHKEARKLLKKWNKTDSKHYKDLKRILDKNKINPGSTVDSVIAEILANIQEIANHTEASKEAKVVGLYASLNRLVHYKIACYDATYKMAKVMGDSKLEKLLKGASKSLNKNAKRLDKYAKKYFLASK
ncbi:MAG: DUF892 family protein [Weeksellaceae bacterium]